VARQAALEDAFTHACYRNLHQTAISLTGEPRFSLSPNCHLRDYAQPIPLLAKPVSGVASLVGHAISGFEGSQHACAEKMNRIRARRGSEFWFSWVHRIWKEDIAPTHTDNTVLLAMLQRAGLLSGGYETVDELLCRWYSHILPT